MYTGIETRSGRLMDFITPDPKVFSIRDIGHALAQTNRFNGHARFPYSVAQHSVYASMMAPVKLKLQALMHDAHEAYVGDMPTPLKELLPGYKAAELVMEEALRKHFDLPLMFDPIVKIIDTRLLVTEAKALGFRWWPNIQADPYPFKIEPWSWEQARDRFIDRYWELTGF